MPRRPRVHLDWVPLHIVQRDHNRGACLFDDQDRRAHLGWLHEALGKERCRLHADVRMTNQVHLLLTPSDARSVPRVLIAVGRRYVQHINRTSGDADEMPSWHSISSPSKGCDSWKAPVSGTWGA